MAKYFYNRAPKLPYPTEPKKKETARKGMPMRTVDVI